MGRTVAHAAGEQGEVLPAWSEALQHCVKVLTEKDLLTSGPFDLDTFIARLERHEGRRIHMTPIQQPAGARSSICGLSVLRPDKYAVYYIDSHSSLHQSHNKLHELAHQILGHNRPGNAGGTDAQEQEADAMAAVLLGSWREPPPPRWATTSDVQLNADRTIDVLLKRGARPVVLPLLASIVLAGLCSLPAMADLIGRSTHGLPYAATLLPFLFAGLAGTLLFALARRAAPMSWIVGVPPTAAGLLIALCQIVIGEAPSVEEPRPETLAQTEVAALVVVTTVAVGLSAAMLAANTMPFLGYIRRRTDRLAAILIAFGLLTAGFGGLLQAALLLGGGLTDSTQRANLTAVSLIIVSGPVIAAAGVAARAAVDVSRPLRRLARSYVSYRRLRPLAAFLGEAAPQWRQGVEQNRWQDARRLRPAQLQARLYQRVIMLRDASWTLLGVIDDHVVDHAVDFATRCHSRPGRKHQVEATAEACWLACAFERAARPGAATEQLVIVEDARDTTLGDLAEEAKFLESVARALRRRRLIRSFLDEHAARPPEPEKAPA
ncbi:hypothetical protein GCM10023175_53970 [Pseudonocardia xishanensis]|uniref:DUF6545 domain-containing protein n=2 Tax=Pseudonocardia xishanensis TaxID=630995 RepID=A0ABP8RYQ4_9PSEU